MIDFQSDFYDEDPARYKLILNALNKFDLDITPSGSLEQVKEAEDFWRKLWSECDGMDDEGRKAYLRAQIPKYFRSCGEPPHWIQNPDWPFCGGLPMVFVGQNDVDAKGLAGTFFHDDVSYYVFMPSYDLMKERQYYEDRLILQRW